MSFFDPSIPRKSRVVDSSLTVTLDGVPLPSVVEISESGTCNRSCAFCPRSDPSYPDIKEFIDPALIEKLSAQLAAVDYAGIFLFSGFVEPLLDKNINELIATVRRNLPAAKIELVTNGDALNDARLKNLFAAGLSTILISVYDGKADADMFEAMVKRVGLAPEQFVIRHRYLPPEQDFGISLSNRAGMMSHAEHAIGNPSEPLHRACHYPHYTFFMDYLGDVLLCPHDWGKRLIVGNMKRQDFMEIWTGKAFAAARRGLAAADRGFDPCKSCDVKGTYMGANHVEAWAKVAAAKGR